MVPKEIEGRPIPPPLVASFEETIEQFHGITAAYLATIQGTLQRLGRAWAYVPEAAEYLTGFTLGKDDDDE